MFSNAFKRSTLIAIMAVSGAVAYSHAFAEICTVPQAIESQKMGVAGCPEPLLPPVTPPPTTPSSETSTFVTLKNDILVNTTSYVNVLQKNINITKPNTRVLVVADGRYYPVDAPAGSVRIAINGSEAYSSYAITDWGSANKSAAAQHSFNVIAHAILQPGVHSFSLRAGAHPTRTGRFVVGTSSGMSIFLDPGDSTTVSSLVGESVAINVTTYSPPGVDVIEGGQNRPTVSILNNQVVNNGANTKLVASLASARAFHACSGFGDALTGIFQDNMCQWTDTASWSVNDIDPGAELQAPMYNHSLYPVASGQSTNISFRASELAFGSDQATSNSGAHENKVCYKLGSAKLISILGGNVIGGAGGDSTHCSTYRWKCVASTVGWGGCPAASTDTVIASKVINVPLGHNGIIFFSAKSRIQGANTDSFMTARLGIKIDGNKRGAIGIQQLPKNYGEASRTLTASYLSAPGDDSTVLAPGQHLVEVYMNVEGSAIQHASVPHELSLVYFD